MNIGDKIIANRTVKVGEKIYFYEGEHAQIEKQRVDGYLQVVFLNQNEHRLNDEILWDNKMIVNAKDFTLIH